MILKVRSLAVISKLVYTLNTMRFLLALIIAVILPLSFSQAADVSVFQRDLYDRLTIEDALSIDTIDNRVSITLSDNIGESDIVYLQGQIRGVSDINSDGKTLTLTLNEAVDNTRYFEIGGRIILDIFLDMDRLSALQNAVELPKPETEAEPIAEVIEPTPTPALETEPTQIQPEQAPLVKLVEEDSPPLPTAQTLPPLADPTMITISSTTPFGLSVFQRYQRLFIVTDQEDMAVLPQIAGAGLDLKWSLQDIEMANGRAWMMPLPKGAYIRAEGRGLIWRLVISDINPQIKSPNIRRRLVETDNPQIVIPMQNISKLLKLSDPDYGDNLAVVTVKRVQSGMNRAYQFTDFAVLPSIIGAAIKPASDGLRVEAANDFITITHAEGLNIAPESHAAIIQSYTQNKNDTQNFEDSAPPQTLLERIYYFPDWGGGVRAEDFPDRRRDLDGFLAMTADEGKLDVILDLAKLSLSQTLGQEALGYLSLASALNPQIRQASEYKALRGAAHYLAGQYDTAIQYLSAQDISGIAEAGLWRAATHAALGNHERALENFQDNAVLAAVYPYPIRQKVLAPLTYAMLEQGEANEALGLTEILEDNLKSQKYRLTLDDRATIAYLKGRAQLMTGRPDEGIANLYKAAKGDKLGPYGIRSEMLLVQDELARDVIDLDEAIKRMERLRFAWRGDSMEFDIQASLGKLYIQNAQPRRGLTTLKRAATQTPSEKDRRAIVRMMTEAYQSIFLDNEFADLDPLIAVAVYDEFKELTPVGERGNALISALADKLMSISLYSRAADVLTDKMERLGEGQEAILSGLRIARIELLDGEARAALETLNQVDDMMALYRGDDKDDLNAQIVLLKAKSFSELGDPQRALFMMEGLDDTDDVIRLRVETAWRAGKWISASDSLGKLLARQNMSDSQPPTEQQAQLILNQAVALSLSDQYDALQRFSARYDMMMKQTPFYKQFQVVTRPQNISSLADRQTLMDVTSEVDLFQGVLERAE